MNMSQQSPRRSGLIPSIFGFLSRFSYKGHSRSILVVFVSIIIVELCLASYVFMRYPQSVLVAQVLSARIIELTNNERSARTTSVLQTNVLLQQAAQAKAEDMAAKGYFSHITPEGKTPWYWIKQQGYTYKYAGENLAVNFDDSKEAVSAWMNSPLHRANLLNRDFTEIGIGIAVGTYKGLPAVFVVQLLAKPR